MSNLEQQAKALSAQVAKLSPVSQRKTYKKVIKKASPYKSIGNKPLPWATAKPMLRKAPVRTPYPYQATKVQHGHDGITPVKGVDYMTPFEMSLIKDSILNEILKDKERFSQVLEEILKDRKLSINDLADVDTFKMETRGGLATTYKIEELMHGGGSSTSTGGTPLTPTGTVNAVNTVFGVVSQPSSVISDGIMYFLNNGFTYAALSITLDVPPSQYIRYYA